eukprot:2704018-Amphidinium_carterae.2
MLCSTESALHGSDADEACVAMSGADKTLPNRDRSIPNSSAAVKFSDTSPKRPSPQDCVLHTLLSNKLHIV